MDEPDRSIYENSVGDYRGWYEDGAYFAIPDPGSEILGEEAEGEWEEEMETDPQLAYFDSILNRYETLREQLRQTPPQEALDKLDDDHPVHIPRLNVQISRRWRWVMRTIDPVPAQLASMEKETVLRLLRLMAGGSLLRRGTEVDVGISRWAWGLLARLPEKGELNSEEIGVVRELGKKAVLVGMGLRDEKGWEEGMNELEASCDDDGELEGEVVINEEEIQVDEDGEDILPVSALVDPETAENGAGETVSISRILDKEIEQGEIPSSTAPEPLSPPMTRTPESSDLETAKARLLQGLSSEASEPTTEEAPKKKEAIFNLNTKATVDMIITIAGEVYGQRDLLEFRGMWGEVS